MPKEVQFIDVTPEWVSLHPVFCEWIDNGTPEQKELVKSELLKLCKVADAVNKQKKQVS